MLKNTRKLVKKWELSLDPYRRNIEVKDIFSYPYEPQVTIKEDDVLVYCNHVNQEIEPVVFEDGQDNEYTLLLNVCQVCDMGWDKEGELILEGF